MELLEKGSQWEKILVVRELGRVKDTALWDFARPSITALSSDMSFPS